MADATVDGIRLTYDVFGEGAPVLLVCGTGQRAFTWQIFQVPALVAAGYQVVTFDNRGMAPSDCPPAPYTVQEMAADTAGLIEHLGIGPCPVAGLSLGAFITQELALARPDLVRAAVLMGTFGRQDVFRRAISDGWVELEEAGVKLPPTFEAVMLAFSIFSPFALCDDARVQQYLDVSMAMPVWENPGRQGQTDADRVYDGRLKALGDVRVRTLVIGFELDMLTPASLSREVAQAIPGSRYLEVAACGHGGPFEKPQEVNRALIAFFAEG
jgi:pimeloyl-ACP methyl ester carboxylesterase